MVGDGRSVVGLTGAQWQCWVQFACAAKCVRLGDACWVRLGDASDVQVEK